MDEWTKRIDEKVNQWYNGQYWMWSMEQWIVINGTMDSNIGCGPWNNG